MLYLSQFNFPGQQAENHFITDIKRTCYDTVYPFKILSQLEMPFMTFEPVTILCGGNGSGKTTALNVIGEALGLERDTLYNRSSFFDDYIKLCSYRLSKALPAASRVITSDDVFDYVLNLRMMNEGIDMRREEMFEDYLDAKYSDFHFKTMEDYERLKKVNLTRRTTQSRYVRKGLMDNVREHSNGESAFKYFVQKTESEGLYLMDEPENSLSTARQKELAEYIRDTARFFGGQFIIATHSPFIASIEGAKVYDMDETPVAEKKWTQIANIRKHYDFFREHESEFED